MDRLNEIAAQLRNGKEVPPVSVREFLSWFTAQRRGYWIVEWIRRSLNEAGLETEPDFESAYIDSPIRFSIAPLSEAADIAEFHGEVSEATQGGALSTSIAPTATVYADPTYRISKLAAANNSPISVPPDATIQQAVTLMLSNDFSQLPVMVNERDVKGIVSWASIGVRLALEKNGDRVKDLMDRHQEIKLESSLFEAIPIIVQHQYVLVRGPDSRITGIVTASDLSRQFLQMTEPFLLLGEIENHIRRILAERFSTEDFTKVIDPRDSKRKIESVASLSFGEYIRLIENEERWTRLGIAIDRVIFCKQLDRVRQIRNDVMHFDPDGIPPQDLESLRDFAQFLQRLHLVGVPHRK
jgi:CBS domain-containing protein